MQEQNEVEQHNIYPKICSRGKKTIKFKSK